MSASQKVLSTRRIYEGKIIGVREDTVLLENQRATTREVVEHNGGVGILAIGPRDTLLMVRQHRTGAGKALLEIPAGKRDKDEAPMTCGIRELEEETGYKAEVFMPMGYLYPTPAYCEEVIYLFYAKNLIKTAQHLDENEFLEVEEIPFSQALEMVLNGEITDAKSQIAILKYHELNRRGMA
ncbi:NUDIX hydrolase [Oscillospiraceae bacterium MB08-C2-2]|nr:NUDIX hydrolase [Oscillospiraceae bacterium MB08-C2-2]